ncbi:VWA-like domain-containing protein [Deinococcus psychrotolerans]|nr:VWA-like domain-containing protein [Deinococcus psychrotolerans]
MTLPKFNLPRLNIRQRPDGATALGDGQFQAIIQLLSSQWPHQRNATRRFGQQTLKQLKASDRELIDLLPISGPILVSPCGWSVVPASSENVLPRVAGLDITELAAWSHWMREAHLAAVRRNPALIAQASDLLLTKLEAQGFQTQEQALKAGRLTEPLRLVSAALSLSVYASFPGKAAIQPLPPARLKLTDNLKRLEAGEVTWQEVEPWGPALWPFAWHPVLTQLGRDEDANQLRALHSLGGAVWHHPDMKALMEKAAQFQQQQTLELLKYRAEQRLQDTQLTAGLLGAANDTIITKSNSRANALQLSLQETAAAIQAAVLGHEHPKKTSVESSVQKWLSAWGQLDTLLPELRHLRSMLRLDLDPRTAERLHVRLAAYDPRPRSGRPWGEIVVNVMNAERGQGSDLARVLCRLVVSAALRQPERGQRRHAVLWSAACAMINEAWFDELGLPPLSSQLDPQPNRDTELERLGSAEAIYAELLRRQGRERSLSGSRGAGLSDFIADDENASALSEAEEGALRKAIGRGLEEAVFLRSAGEGHGGLVRELRAVAADPVAWRPKLLEWASPHYPRPQRKARWDRLSRRTPSDSQMALPSFRGEERSGVQLVVIADTSASMDDETLEEGLGAIVQTCAVLEIGALRLISCDTQATDHGVMSPWLLRQAVKLSGGGGTELQDGVELLNSLSRPSSDLRFPSVPLSTPLLILTDGLFWKKVEIKSGRPHAWLLPRNARLPFHTTAPVFTIRKR